MQVEDKSRAAPTVITIGADNDERERVCSSWINFDAAACQCFDARDKTRIISVIQRYPDGIDGFNQHMRTLATDIFGQSRSSPAWSSRARSQHVTSTRSVAPVAQPQQLGAELANLVDVMPGLVPSESHES